MGMADGMGTFMVWGWLFGALLLGGIVLLIVLLVRVIAGGFDRGPRPAGRQSANRAQRILAERYARGEIDAAEYHERLRHLEDA